MDFGQHTRSVPLLGEDGLLRLQNAKVAVFGVGGVGGHLCEALARAGVGELHLFDKDTVSLSNINRQAVALHSTIGLPKVEVMRARIADINPDCRVVTHEVFYLPENADNYDLSQYDHIADAIDTVSAKIELICRAKAAELFEFKLFFLLIAPCSSASGHSVHAEHNTRDIGCFIRCQEYKGVGDIFRFSQPPQGDSCDHRLNDFFGNGTHHVCFRDSRGYGIDANSLRAELSCQG